MKYRRAIDGLRAIVVPVMFFHAGFESFAGGFIGVDVFFVISGYLITTLILTELERGQFTLARFYERRARRRATRAATLRSAPARSGQLVGCWGCDQARRQKQVYAETGEF